MKMYKSKSHVSCAAYCSNSYRKKPGLSFFKFPSQKERCSQWVTRCRVVGLQNKTVEALHKNYILCAEHFEDSQFMNAAKKDRLIHSAIPRIFDFTNPPKPQVNTVKRHFKKRKKLIEPEAEESIGTSTSQSVMEWVDTSGQTCATDDIVGQVYHEMSTSAPVVYTYFSELCNEAYELAADTEVWRVLDDTPDYITIGSLQAHQTFITVIITANDFLAEIAAFGIPRRQKYSVRNVKLRLFIDAISLMSVCPGIEDEQLQKLVDPSKQDAEFFRHFSFTTLNGAVMCSSRILSRFCPRLLAPSESLCSPCELVYKQLINADLLPGGD